MEEVIKYFEGLEERIATLEAELASLEAELDELKNRPQPEPQILTPKEPEMPETPEIPEEPAAEPEAIAEPEPVVEPEPAKVEPVKVEPAPAVAEEKASPKAAIYGKAVDDIRQAISLGDRFLYQRELFGQNAELMQKSLTELNGLGSFEEAMDYISRFDWDTESNSYQQFIVTLHRRFG